MTKEKAIHHIKAGVYRQLLRLFPIFSCIQVIVFCFLFAAGSVKCFRKHKVNFIYIFNILQANKMNEYHFFKAYLFLQAGVTLTAILELMSIKHFVESWNWGASEETGPNNLPTLVLIVTLLILLVIPCNFFNRAFRIELLYSLL